MFPLVFVECLSTHLFIQAVLHSELMTLDWFCNNLQYVMQYIPKPHNHQGTACLFTVLKPQNSWQSIKDCCVCQRSEESLLAHIMANYLNSPRRIGRHQGIVAVLLVLLYNPLFKMSLTEKLEILCSVKIWMSQRWRHAEMVGIQ